MIQEAIPIIDKIILEDTTIRDFSENLLLGDLILEAIASIEAEVEIRDRTMIIIITRINKVVIITTKKINSQDKIIGKRSLKKEVAITRRSLIKEETLPRDTKTINSESSSHIREAAAERKEGIEEIKTIKETNTEEVTAIIIEEASEEIEAATEETEALEGLEAAIEETEEAEEEEWTRKSLRNIPLMRPKRNRPLSNFWLSRLALKYRNRHTKTSIMITLNSIKLQWINKNHHKLSIILQDLIRCLVLMPQVANNNDDTFIRKRFLYVN